MTFSEYVQRYHQGMCPDQHSQAKCVRLLMNHALKDPNSLGPDAPDAMDASKLNKYYNGTNNISGPAPAWLEHLDTAKLAKHLGKDTAARQRLCDAFQDLLPDLRPSLTPARLTDQLESILRLAAENKTELPASGAYHLFVLDLPKIPKQGSWNFAVPGEQALCKPFTEDDFTLFQPGVIPNLLRCPALILDLDTDGPARLARLTDITPQEDDVRIDCKIIGLFPREELRSHPDDYALAHRPGTFYHELNIPHWALKHAALPL